MEDVIQIIGGGAGYAILALASVVFWRMFRYLEKDRDFWRNEALGRKKALDEALDAGETLVKPLKKVRKVAAGQDRIAELEGIVRLLLAEKEER